MEGEDVASDHGGEEAFTEFLMRHHYQQLHAIVLSEDSKLHYPLHIDFAELMDDNPPLSHFLFSQPTEFLRQFDQCALSAHKVVLKNLKSGEKGIEKKFIHVRINVGGSPLEFPETYPRIGRVRVNHQRILLTLKGTVIRSGAIKMYEGERIYRCRKCKHEFSAYPELESRNSITLPPFCPSSQRSNPCEGTKFDSVDETVVRHDYQEIKIQESTQVLGVGVIPRSIPIILKDDLVDTVKAGDDVIVTGILTAKWSPDIKDVRCNLDPVLIANHVRRNNELKSDVDIPSNLVMMFRMFWSNSKDAPLKGRNVILRGICPQVFGLFTVKLAVALTLIGGVQHVDPSGTKIRGESHLLLVGDPGTGKSQFLKFAAKLSNRSVITTGLGSTSAGLTVTAIKDGGDWVLEAGALVLADGGLCCIDEFDSMREHDRATIHEVMEQQTISVAKAGLVTTLCARTIVFGATNPKGQYDPEQCLILFLSSWIRKIPNGMKLCRPTFFMRRPCKIHLQGETWNEDDNVDLANTWPVSMLRRYIHFVKGYFKPVLTKEAETVISSYYQLQRRSATHNAARTTVRMLESLIRLAQGLMMRVGPIILLIHKRQGWVAWVMAICVVLNLNAAHARLMFRDKVTQLDAIMAILCMESSMTTSAIVDNAGNSLHSNFAEHPDEEYAKQETLILEKLEIRK